MATHTGHVMNLANSIIGVSLLAMPFCFKQCGITLAIIMLILSSIISRMACHFLVKSSNMCRRRNFEFLAFYTFGPSGKLLVEIGVIGFMMGTCVAFFVVMGDLGPAIISKIFNISNSNTLRTSVLIGLSLLVVLPLGLLKNVESLAAVSTVTIGFYFLFIIKIFFESSPRLLNGDWWYHVNFWQPEGILQCIPIFAMALSCQTQLFEIYDSLPMPTIEKMNSVVHSALNICTLVYTSVGLLGYIAYCKGSFSGNILLSFTPSFSSEMFKLGFVLSIAVSFPLVIFPCRASLFSLIFKRMPIHHEFSQTSSHIPDSRFKFLTIVIVSVALITGLLIPSIELVLGFVGSTIGIAICVIFPSLSFLNLHNKNTSERLMAKITLFTGLIIMVMGTFGNLFAAVENKPLEALPAKFLNQKNLPQLKAPSPMYGSTEISNNLKKEALIAHSLPPEKLFPFESPVTIKSKSKFSENRRKEPPFPVAPDSNIKESNIRSQSKVIESNKIIEKKEEYKNKSYFKKLEMDSKPIVIQKNHINEKINKDAIAKEEREIMEMEKQKKGEENKKQEELLKKLKEHQDEQKKLLREQEKILIELKHRENEKKAVEVSKEKTISHIDDILKENIKQKKTIKEEVKVLESVQPPGNVLGKEKTNKTENIFLPNYKVNENLKDKNDLQSQKILPRETNSFKNKNFNELPENSLAKKTAVTSLSTNHSLRRESDKSAELLKPSLKSKQEILARDILVNEKYQGNIMREKRDAAKDDEGTDGSACVDEKVKADLNKAPPVEKKLAQGKEASDAGSRATAKPHQDFVAVEKETEELPSKSNQLLAPKERDLKFT